MLNDPFALLIAPERSVEVLTLARPMHRAETFGPSPA
jgi:hypothetical protein